MKYTNQIRVYRAVYSLTQKNLGDAVGVTRQTIAKVEKESPPTLLIAFKLAKYFNEPIEKIFNYE